MTLIVDAADVVLGRLASYAAKQALLGRDVIIVNSEKALVSGKPGRIVKENIKKLGIKNKGALNIGPYHFHRPDRFVRRSIRGMLPHKTPRGREAFKRVMVYIGEPVVEVKRSCGVDITKEKKAKLTDLRKNVDSCLTVGELCKSIGGKWQTN